MTFYTRKILFGLVLSGAGILLTIAWYKFDLSKSRIAGAENKKVLAKLANVVNDVQKKEAQRVIWQNLGDSDELHAGEAVRTAADSEAKIVFISGAQIEMDPESVITIEETGDKINLNFVKGNLLVKGTGGARAGGLALKSGNTDIDLNNSEVALNKASGQGMNVQVLQGTAVMNQGGNKVTLDKDKSGEINEQGGMNVTEQFLKIKSPTAFSKIYIRADKKESIPFEWLPLADGYDVYLEIGKTRETMARMYPKVSGKAGVLAMPLKLGPYFWRLVAVSSTDAQKIFPSVTNKVSILAEVPPQLLEPKKDSTVVLDQVTKTLPLRWANPAQLERTHVEISDDAQFSKNVYSETLESNVIHQAPLKQDGVYYWRISGFRPGTSKEVVSDTQKFVLKTKLVLSPPELKEMGENSRVNMESIENGSVNLAWLPSDGISKYHVRVFKAEGKNLVPIYDGAVFDVNQIRFMGKKPGVYRWDVSSVASDGKMSPPSKSLTLTVEELPSMQWADNSTEYFYTSPKPQLKVNYRPYPKAAAYKVIYRKLSGELVEEKIDGRASEKIINVGQEGNYTLNVEALSDKGVTLARSRMKEITVKQAPYLPAPEFAAKTPETIQAKKNGLAGFLLKPVTGAKAYVVNLKTADGRLDKTEKYQSTTVWLKNLMPGDYRLSVSTVDGIGRVGPAGKEKKLVVPNVSESRAPTFKKVRIK